MMPHQQQQHQHLHAHHGHAPAPMAGYAQPPPAPLGYANMPPAQPPAPQQPAPPYPYTAAPTAHQPYHHHYPPAVKPPEMLAPGAPPPGAYAHPAHAAQYHHPIPPHGMAQPPAVQPQPPLALPTQPPPTQPTPPLKQQQLGPRIPKRDFHSEALKTYVIVSATLLHCVLTTSNLLLPGARRDLNVIEDLYGAYPYQCSTCAFRFYTQEEMTQHMDWHFRMNRREKERISRAISRSWFPTKQVRTPQITRQKSHEPNRAVLRNGLRRLVRKNSNKQVLWHEIRFDSIRFCLILSILFD